MYGKGTREVANQKAGLPCAAVASGGHVTRGVMAHVYRTLGWGPIIGVRGRGQGGGGNCPSKFGQNSGGNLGKARRKKIMCKISGKSTALPPLTEESPYAHGSNTFQMPFHGTTWSKYTGAWEGHIKVGGG